MKRQILLIDHNPELLQALTPLLQGVNCDVTATPDGLEGLRLAYRLQPDAVILDLDLPEREGWLVCRRLREMSDVPIVAVMATRLKSHLVAALDLGADDFVSKPFNWDEFAARLLAVLRRATLNAQGVAQRAGYTRTDSLCLDSARHLVTVQGKDVELTPIEFRLLATLHRHVGRVLPHHYLLMEVWGPQYVDRMNYVKLYIRYLRQKIEDDPRHPQFIHTEWGVGYYLSEV